MQHLIDSAKQAQGASASVDQLQRLSQLAADYKAAKERVTQLEDSLSQAKARFNRVSQEQIPELLLESGLSSVSLASGEKVVVSENVSASIKDAKSFVEFLDDRGDAGIVKTTFELGKVPPEILAMIINDFNVKYGLFPTVKQGVHHSTLDKYVRELCGVGGKTEAQIPLAKLPDSVKAFTYFKTTIKK